MKTNLIIAGACIALVMSALGFKYEASAPQKKSPSHEQRQNIPDYAVYRQLFHHHMILEAKADEIEQQGKSGKALRSFYQNAAGLSDDQARTFDAIAADCDREVAGQDEKAKTLIDSVRQNYPGGKVPAGQKPPEPPIELKAMQEERNAIILKARDRLRAAFGESEFKRFSEFVERDVKPNVTSEPVGRQLPQTPMGPHRQLPNAVSKGAPQP